MRFFISTSMRKSECEAPCPQSSKVGQTRSMVVAPARALPPTKSRVERRRTLLLLLTFALQPTPVRSRMPTRSRFGRLVASAPRERQWLAGPAVVLQRDTRHLHLETLV